MNSEEDQDVNAPAADRHEGTNGRSDGTSSDRRRRSPTPFPEGRLRPPPIAPDGTGEPDADPFAEDVVEVPIREAAEEPAADPAAPAPHPSQQ